MLNLKANITFLIDSSRNLPIYSGYRPNFKFDNIENTYVDGAIFFEEYEKIEKGDNNKIVLLKIPSSDLYDNLIYENQNFYFYEGRSLIGKGFVEKIVQEKTNQLINKVDIIFNYNHYSDPIVLGSGYEFFVFDSFFIKEKEGSFLLNRLIVENTKFEYLYGLSNFFEYQNLENSRVFKFDEKEFLSKDIRNESLEVINDPRSNTTNYSNGKISLLKKSVYDFYTYFDFIVYVLEDKNIFIIESFRTDHTIVMINKENLLLEDHPILKLFLKKENYIAKRNFVSLELLEELRNIFFYKSISK